MRTPWEFIKQQTLQMRPRYCGTKSKSMCARGPSGGKGKYTRKHSWNRAAPTKKDVPVVLQPRQHIECFVFAFHFQACRQLCTRTRPGNHVLFYGGPECTVSRVWR